jgi:diguanylate cyclase (GGDEF)-like protein
MGAVRPEPAGKVRLPWWLLTLAAAIGLLVSWQAERFAVDAASVDFQRTVGRLASHLSDTRDKSQTLGAVWALGMTDPVIRATAAGQLPPDNAAAKALLSTVALAFGLSELFIVDKAGVIVAYETNPPAGISGLGRNLSFRPYFQVAMQGRPNMYAALGVNSDKRGMYIAAPAVDAGNVVVGVIVAKIGFEEIDALLAKEPEPFALLAPEGMVFATNIPEQLFHVGPGHDPAGVAGASRAATAYVSAPPQPLAVGSGGILDDAERQRRMFSATVEWNDPEGGVWVLAGFYDPTRRFGRVEHVFSGVVTFFLVIFFGAWLQTKLRLVLRAKELEAANAQLAVLTGTDPLTGLANRRRLDEVLGREWSRAKRSGLPLAILMADIDDFKNFNDLYGHAAGDDCLRLVANAILSTVRHDLDLVCRYGGEEFAIILPDTGPGPAVEMAQSIRQAIESLALTHADSPAGVVTISIGLAVCDGSALASVDAYIHLADKALYRAKTGGRNRVVLENAALVAT